MQSVAVVRCLPADEYVRVRIAAAVTLLIPAARDVEPTIVVRASRFGEQVRAAVRGAERPDRDAGARALAAALATR